jgi:signal-transduction protein with cAMP-binding, CBS, and nucleotidyltransferase domain
MQLMEDKAIRHVPVFDEGNILGVMSVKVCLDSRWQRLSANLPALPEELDSDAGRHAAQLRY